MALSEKIIGRKFKIIQDLGNGGHGSIYLAKDEDNKDNLNSYVIKLAKSEDKKHILLNEIKIIRRLINDKFVPHLYNFDEETPYIVMEYLRNGDLAKYINEPNINFDELLVKLIFKKILKCVQYCHDNKIYHLDIKLGNILLDKNFKIKLADFGVSTEFNQDNNGFRPKLRKKVGTPIYMCPEIIEKREYDGIKVDIFSLGVVLFYLYTKKNPFEKSRNAYHWIKNNNNNYEMFWTNVKVNIFKEEIPQLIKDLYVKMIAYNPDERPSIDDILKNEWMKEIENYGEEKENEDIKAKFLELEDKINKMNSFNLGDSTIAKKSSQNKGISSKNDYTYFKNEKYEIKKINEKEFDSNNCIIINGYIKPIDFMDVLAKKIKEKYKNNCRVDVVDRNLRFGVLFVNEEEEEKEEIDEDEEKEESQIIIELFEINENKYSIKLIRKEGEIEDFYEHFIEIREIIKKLTIN